MRFLHFVSNKDQNIMKPSFNYIELSDKAGRRENSARLFHKVLKDISATSWHNEARGPLAPGLPGTSHRKILSGPVVLKNCVFILSDMNVSITQSLLSCDEVSQTP